MHAFRPCATSSFSRNRPRIVEADLSLPTAPYDVHLCGKSVSLSSNNKAKVAAPPRTALDDIASIRQWFQNRFTGATASNTIKKTPPHRASTPHDHHGNEVPVSHLQPSELAGSIVLADRGQCLFEDKAHVADQAGAVGLIVKNNEVTSIITAFVYWLAIYIICLIVCYFRILSL